MSSIYTGRRRRPQEFTLPDGKKVIASLPEDLEDLRRKYGDQHGVQIEIVVHGSPEHSQYLTQTRDHHEKRRSQLREKHGPAFDEWEDVHYQLNHVNSELERLNTNTTSLNANFNKFGYGAYLRAYDDEAGEGEVAASSASSMSDTLSVSSGRSVRLGETTKLFKKPVVKQWFHQGLLWRASEHTEIQAIELFFDLLYVGIIHVNGEHLWAEPNGHELLRYAVTFIMSWKLWSDLTLTLSWFETDDIFSRFEMLFEIACLLGFTTNMTYSFYEDEKHNTYTMLVSFYLAARLKGVLHYAITSYFLPMVRGVMICECINILIPSSLWIASIHVSMPSRLGLIWVAIALDLWGQSIPIGLFRYGQTVGDKTRLGRFLSSFFEFYPAVNIEHRVERTNAFVSLVFGYSVMGIMFQSYGGYSVNGFLGKAVMGLAQAFIFNWIYFDIDGYNIDVHAIRRAVPSGEWRRFLFEMLLTLDSCGLGLRSLALHHGLHSRLGGTVEARLRHGHAAHEPGAAVGALHGTDVALDPQRHPLLLLPRPRHGAPLHGGHLGLPRAPRAPEPALE